MLEQAKREGTVDVYGFVSEMRNQRMKMVQVEVSLKLYVIILSSSIYFPQSLNRVSCI